MTLALLIGWPTRISGFGWPHGHVAAVHALAREPGLPALLGPAGQQRDLALARVISRVVAPGSKCPP